MKEKLLNSIACPKCFGTLNYNEEQQTLTCLNDSLVFTIIDSIPVLIENEAKSINTKKIGDNL